MTYTRRCCGCCRVITPAAGKVKRHVTYDFADSWSDNAATPERLDIGRDGGPCHHHDHDYCPLDHFHRPHITTSRNVTACPLRDLRHPVRHVDPHHCSCHFWSRHHDHQGAYCTPTQTPSLKVWYTR
ncbi:hypothetical protein AaE_015125 [Aphanomyces astaci]|uniref:Uncharacterized protein n=1 Tax=Aphanomyces astaci TaxID=112090 RepID=A0A6A4YXC2_APHAT|nr:hypothetical protein AaE_015125 [Aphanomyces astaci]